MDNLAIIPARGGSKRIVGKNIKLFLGKPIIAYSVETAIKSGLFSEVMVSTDSKEIAEIAKEYGAKVPFYRSSQNADDHAILSDVIDEVLSKYNKEFKYICCILPTAPLITEEMLLQGLELLEREKFDSVRPVVQFSYPIQRAIKLGCQNNMEFFHPEYYKTRSQDLERSYHDAGQFYWMTNESRLHGTSKGAFVIDNNQAQDIDTMEDWKLAEMKYLLNKEK